MTCDRVIDLMFVVVGALIGTVGTFIAQYLRQAHERRSWHQDFLMRTSAEVMGRVSRLALSLAYTPAHLSKVGWATVSEQALGLDDHLRVLGMLIDDEGEEVVKELVGTLAPLVIEYSKSPGAVSQVSRDGLAAKVEALRIALSKSLGRR